jgi:RNA polymerase sigma-70 factor (ECF subfamily)
MATSRSPSASGDAEGQSSAGTPGPTPIGGRSRRRLEELFDLHESLVFGFLLARTGDRALAEDLTTETFLGLARRAAREPGAVDDVDGSLMVTIARRRLVDHWRALSARQRLLDSVRAEMVRNFVDPTSDVELHAADEQVLDALASLPPRQRAALTLRHLDELSVTEVAEALDTTYGATESILARARRSFRKAYGEVRATSDEEGGSND